MYSRCRLAGVADAFWSGRELPEGCGPLLQQCREELEWSLQQARACGMFATAADCAFELATLCDPADKKQRAAQACHSQSLSASADIQTLMQATLSAESRERVMQRLVQHCGDCGWPADCRASTGARELLLKMSPAEQRCVCDLGDFELVAGKQGAGCMLLSLASRCIGSQVRRAPVKALFAFACLQFRRRLLCRRAFVDSPVCVCSWKSSLCASRALLSLHLSTPRPKHPLLHLLVSVPHASPPFPAPALQTRLFCPLSSGAPLQLLARCECHIFSLCFCAAAVLPLDERMQIMRHFVQVPALSEVAACSRSWRDAMQRASLRLLAAADASFDPQLAADQVSFVQQFMEMMQQPLQLLASDDAVKTVTVIAGQALWDVTWEPLVKSVAADAAVVRDCSCSMLRHRLKAIEAAGAKPLKKGPGGCSFIVDPRAEGNSSSAGGGMAAQFKASVHKQSSDWTGVYGDDHIPSGYEWQKSVLSASSFLFCGFQVCQV